ncbi:MAG: hypothetical protein IKU89_01650 [Oscillospiraceae bacterium]|nr:hypothetical protein [Oscillospiraceae bacterium]
MKKLFALLIAVVICFSLVACGKTGNETFDYILYLLEQGDYDMAIYIIEGLRDGTENSTPDSPNTNAPQVDGNDIFYTLVPDYSNGTDWFFNIDLINQSANTLTLETLLIIDYMDDAQLGTSGFEGPDLERIGLGNFTLAPNQGQGWNDAHPIVLDFNRREYLFVFVDENGEKHRMSYTFNMQGTVPEGFEPQNPDNQQPSGDWSFPCVMYNDTNDPLELVSMDITDLMNGAPLGTYIFEGDDLYNIGLGGVVLQPEERFSWFDGHPFVLDWNAREYRFHFKKPNGETHIISFTFDELDKQNEQTDYSQDSGKDIQTLRHNADFEVEVANSVAWVPANKLGESRYTNQEIFDMLTLSPEEKQAEISTLYEALQLYKIGGFTASDDNRRVYEGGVNWEHHKPGYYAVLTNTGCCATDSNWLRYILSDDYEEVGYIATSQRDGSGHIYNYILDNGYYYIIDLTHYRASDPMTSTENGDLNSYYSTDYILGNIHKVKNIQDYVNYVQREFGDPPGMMFMYTLENCLAVDGARWQDGSVSIIYEDAGKDAVKIIFDDEADSLDFMWKPSPTNLPDWSR